MRKSSSDRLFMLKRDLSVVGSLTELRICAQELECKSKETNQFKWVFIPPIKSNCAGFPTYKVKEIPTVRLPSHR